MKKLLLTTFTLLFAFSLSVQAQNCEPAPEYANADAGVYPLPDPVGSTTSSLNAGCIDMEYEQLFTAVVPDSINVEFSGTEITAELLSVAVNDIENLPAGVSYACEPADCIFLQGTTGCLLFSGTPTEAGDFSPIVRTTVTASIGGPTPLTPNLSFPSQEDDDLPEVFPGQYTVTIYTADNCLINVDDALSGVLGVQQNIPNPFSKTTNITIDSKESGNFDFNVYSLIGELVHSEVLTLSTGENVVEFDASDLNSGMYFYAVGQGNDVVTRRMVVSK